MLQWGLNYNYSPGWTGFKFIIPQNAFMTTQCTEGNNKGLNWRNYNKQRNNTMNKDII